MLSVIRRIRWAADIIPEPDPRLCFPGVSFFFFFKRYWYHFWASIARNDWHVPRIRRKFSTETVSGGSAAIAFAWGGSDRVVISITFVNDNFRKKCSKWRILFSCFKWLKLCMQTLKIFEWKLNCFWFFIFRFQFLLVFHLKIRPLSTVAGAHLFYHSASNRFFLNFSKRTCLPVGGWPPLLLLSTCRAGWRPAQGRG